MIGLVSVIVPTRNRASLLAACVASVLGQDYPREGFEIVVVDDGSTDGTSSVISKILERPHRPEVFYVRLEGLGLNGARNAGIECSHGDLIVFVDDDVIAPSSWLKSMVEGSRRHQDVECFGGPARLQLEGKAPPFCARDGPDGAVDLGDSERYVEYVIGCNMGLLRTAIDRVGVFNRELSGFGDELEWELRLSRAGGRIVYLPSAWLWHRRTARDLRLRSLLLKHFRRAVEEVAFARLVGLRLHIADEVASIPRFLAHALRRRCAGGLCSVSRRLGHVWGSIIH